MPYSWGVYAIHRGGEHTGTLGLKQGILSMESFIFASNIAALMLGGYTVRDPSGLYKPLRPSPPTQNILIYLACR